MSKTDNPETLPVLAAPDSSKPNWRRASVKLIPYIGGALDELVFGQIDEYRWRRLELTLTELGEMMQERGISASKARTEDFGALLEIVGPATSRASDKDKRRLLRDLLLNAVDLPPERSQMGISAIGSWTSICPRAPRSRNPRDARPRRCSRFHYSEPDQNRRHRSDRTPRSIREFHCTTLPLVCPRAGIPQSYH